jgi:hypothetical protein
LFVVSITNLLEVVALFTKAYAAFQLSIDREAVVE